MKSKKSIQQLYLEHNGKLSDKWSLYLDEWDRVFGPYRDLPVSLLEIGVQRGGSLEVWSACFPNAEKIVGCDIDPECGRLRYDDARVAVVVGDANSDDCERMILQQQPSFDVIIDDGSHQSKDIIQSFARYFSHLRESGVYVVEDLHCSYWANYGGSLYGPLSAMAFFKRLADLLNYEHWRNNRSRVSLLTNFAAQYGVEFDQFDLTRIHSIEFVNSLCIIRRLPPEKNVLGRRIIAGSEFGESDGWKKHHGTQIQDYPVDIIDDRNLDVFELTDEIAEKEQVAQTLSSQLAEKEQVAQTLSSQLAEKEQVVQALSSGISEKEHTLGVLTAQLAEKEQVVQALSAQISEKEQALGVRTAQLADEERAKAALSAQVDGILATRAWRVASFLQKLRAKLIPKGSLRARIARKLFRLSLIPFSVRQTEKDGRELRLIRNSNLFDAKWYLAQNSDVAASGIDPALHYLQFGGFEGRDPSPKFSSSWYLATNRDVEQTRVNPLLHYLEYGRHEGRLGYPNTSIAERQNVSHPATSTPIQSRILPRSGDVRTVTFYSHSGMDALAYLRLLGPAKKAGIQIINGVENGRIHVERVIQGDVVVVQRDLPTDLASYEEILTLAHREGEPVIFELDDLLLELPEDHPDRQTHHYTKALLPVLQALTEADLVTVATLPLRDYVLPYNKNVAVLPNYFNDDLWRLRTPVASKKDVLVIGYMGGITHVPDLDMIVPALLDLDKRHPGKLQFRFWGMQPPTVLRSRPNVQWLACNAATYPDFAEYFQRQTADILIAPLRDSLFNDCKSPIKYFEYSALGAPGVFSRIDPYSNVITDGINGLLASSLSDWTEALNRLIEDPELRFVIARNAQENIKSKWLLSSNAARWPEVYGMATKVITGEKPAASPFHGLVRSLAHQVAEERAETTHVVQSWTAQTAQKEQELTEIKGSRAWRAAMVLRRVRVLLIPPDSLRARIAEKLFSFRQGSGLSNDLALIHGSALFDATWYLAQNPDVAKAGIDPALHYLQSGGFEGRDPGPKFSSSWYLAANKDVEQARVNPLLHYLKHGRREGRTPLQSVDADHKSFVYYLRRAFILWKEGGPRLVWEKIRLKLGRPVSPSSNTLSARPVNAISSEDEQKQEMEGFSAKPLISVLIPVYNTPLQYLTAAINSIQRQTYTNFEICICDDGSSDLTLTTELQRISAQDQRIKLFTFAKNNGISAATNKAAELASGDFYAFMDHDDELASNALFEMVRMLNQDPLADVIYSDQDKIDGRGLSSEPFCKPDWSPEYFRAAMYVGHLLLVKKELFHQVGGMLSRFDGVQDYEFMLRASEIAKRIRHIHKILYHWRKIPGSIALGVDEKGDRIEELQVKAVGEQLKRLNIPAIATINPAQRHRVIILPKPRPSFPLVSIIVLAKNAPQNIERCLQSIFNRTSYPNYEVVVVADQTTGKSTLEALNHYPIKVVSFQEDFNFSRANSLGVENARGEFVILLDNHTEVVTLEWIEVLLSYLEREEVGAVGPMLIYPNHTVQHAGIALGIGGAADHVMRHFLYTSDGYAGSLCCPREVSAVTGACMVLRHSDFVELGGLVEYYATQYQDVDLCLRILRTGKRILYVPHAVLIYNEDLAGGASRDFMDRALFLDIWGDIVARGDPYYNRNFSLAAGDYSFKSEDRA